jgi:hypothetical protein
VFILMYTQILKCDHFLCAVLSNQVSVAIFVSVSLSLSFSYVPEGLNLRNGGVNVVDHFWEFQRKKSFYIAVVVKCL